MKSKPKILLDEVHLPALKSAFEIITEHSKFFDAYDATLSAMTSHESKFNSEVEALEANADYLNEDAVRTIHTRRGQLELLRRQLAKLKNAVAPHSNALIVEIEKLPLLITRLVKPEQNRLHRQLCEKLRPIYHHGEALLAAASNAPEFLSFVQHFNPRLDVYQHNAPKRAREVLPLLAALVAGENNWSFEAQPETESAPT